MTIFVKVNNGCKTPPDVTRISKRTDGGPIPKKKALKFLMKNMTLLSKKTDGRGFRKKTRDEAFEIYL